MTGAALQPHLCGLDFGTTNSTVAIAHDNGALLVPVEDDKETIPSAIFFAAGGTGPLFGREAIGEYMSGEPGRLMRALKSILGHGLLHEKTLVQRRYLEFADILSIFLGHLKSEAERSIDQEITHVVLGRPVQFIEDDAEADRTAQADLEAAARGVGFEHIEFQYEPIAAALEYERQVRGEEIVLIVDLGGGTSDFSIVRVSPARAKKSERSSDILANRGIRVGGTDFDRMLSMGHVMPLLGLGSAYGDKGLEVPRGVYVDLSTWSQINFVYEKKQALGLTSLRRQAAAPELIDRLIRVIEEREGHRLIGDIEQAKIELSEAESAAMALGYIEPELGVALTRRQLTRAITPGLARIRRCIEDTVADAGLECAHVKTVFLTGGSAMAPAIRAQVEALFPGAKITQGDMLGSVGKGLGLDALRRFG